MNSRIPLFEFAIRSVLSQMDLRSAEGRVQGLRASAGIVAHIKDLALRAEYTRQSLDGSAWTCGTVEQAVRAAGRVEVITPGPRPGEI